MMLETNTRDNIKVITEPQADPPAPKKEKEKEKETQIKTAI